MIRQFRSYNFYILIALDLGLVLLAHWLSYVTRFEANIPHEQYTYFVQLIPVFSVTKLGCFYFYDLYRGMWRYTSFHDLFNIIKAATAASLIIMAMLLLAHRFEGFSRSVFILDWLFTVILLSGLRIGIRLVYGLRFIPLPRILPRKHSSPARKCVLLGAGAAAEKLIRDLTANSESPFEFVAVFDDDSGKHGRILHGLPIVGPIKSLPYWLESEGASVQEILIAMPSVGGDELRTIVTICEESGLPFQTIPSLSEIASGKVSIKALRDVDYKDLLTRGEARLDMDRISEYLEGKTVLITGAGGSIGSTLCRQILRFSPGKLLLLDSSEANLYAIQMELEHEREFKDYEPLLGSLQDRDWTSYILDAHKPDVIFHAAAYKHVPMLESNPWQAVYNNVQATSLLIELAVERNVERFLVVSTDKAVRPTNIMGASKRLTERVMQAHCQSSTRLMAVRFGNVVGSAGSVIPLFRSQIERGGPVTVTHPDVVRYFMTVEEACQLILQAGSMGGEGEIFVLKMGQPVKIAEMAEDLIRLSGKEPGRDVEIKFIGLRPGEKLYEELITEDEGVVPTEHDQIMVLKGEGCRMEDLSPDITALVQAADSRDLKRIIEALTRLVPEYTPANNG